MDLKTAGEFTAKLIGYFGVAGFTYAMMYLLSCGYYAIFPIWLLIVWSIYRNRTLSFSLEIDYEE